MNDAKQIKRIICVGVLAVLFPLLSEAKETPQQIPSSPEQFQMCVDHELGVKFPCRQDWKIQPVDNAVLIVISSSPDVSLIVAKMRSPVRYLEQLTNSVLKNMNQYAEGFVTERVKVGSGSAIKVKAFSRKEPDRRLLDYYFVHDASVYSILFSVNPKDKLEDYKFLFQNIVDSFSFVAAQKNVLNTAQ